jgi:hypothetical protein
MTRNDDRPGAPQPQQARHRALLATAIGLCLSVPPGVAGEVAGIQRFHVHPESGSVLLTWRLPSVTTFSRLVIRYRIDGPAPFSPDEGFPLFDERTPPGAMYGQRHTGLSPQHVYSYAAFGVDASGVVRASTTAVGTPLAWQLPATVQNLRRTDTGGTPDAPSAAQSGQ